MADKADVRSIEQLELFQEHIERLRNQLLTELEALSLELRRLSRWLEGDVLGYWRDESIRAERRMRQCSDALTRCMSYVREDERRPCTEEKKRFHRAQMRWELCQQKSRIAQAALARWAAECSRQQGHRQRSREMAEADLVVAVHYLRDQIATLRTYAGLRSAASPDPMPTTSTSVDVLSVPHDSNQEPTDETNRP